MSQTRNAAQSNIYQVFLDIIDKYDVIPDEHYEGVQNYVVGKLGDSGLDAIKSNRYEKLDQLIVALRAKYSDWWNESFSKKVMEIHHMILIKYSFIVLVL